MNNDWREYSAYDYSYLAHHGIKGQRWGIRRFQNEDGTLTAKGQKRYGEKVTMHNGKSNFFTGGAKYQTHKEYMTANKFAKGTYLQRKAEIKDQKKADMAKADTFGKKVGAQVKSMRSNADNKAQYQYELDRNRHNAGKAEFKRAVVTETAKNTAKQAAKVGAGILAGYLVVNTANAVQNRMNGGVSKNKNAIATLGANKLDSHWEYSVGKKEVAKVLLKAAAGGAAIGALKGINDNLSAEERIRNQNNFDKTYGVKNTRAKRAEEDERRWKKGQV